MGTSSLFSWNFKRLTLAQFLFTMAVQMQAVIIGWRVYDLSGDPLFLGLVGLVEAIPALSLALYAGYLVDRNIPLKIYRKVLTVSLCSGLLLLVSTVGLQHVSIILQLILLYCSSFLTGCARAFSQPAVFATVPQMVPRPLLSKAAAWSSSLRQTARVIGPAFGGLLYGWMGVQSTAAVICVLLISAIVTVVLIKHPQEKPVVNKDRKLREELFTGLQFVLSHPILFPGMTLDMVSVLFGGVTALLPIYAKEILMIGPKGLGLLRAAPAVGAMIMGSVLTKTHIHKKAGSTLFLAVTGFGVCILIFALSKNFYLSMAALVASGAFDSVSMIIRSTAVQLTSPDGMRGRIASVNSMFIGSSNELGEFESGLAARFLGTVPAAVFGGCVCLLTVGILALKFPTLRKMNLKELE